MDNRPESIKVIYWNINSFRIKKTDLDDLIKENSPDIICLQETKCTSNIKIAVPGYHTYRFDRDQPAGGVAILIKPEMPHSFQGSNQNISIDNVTVKIHTRNGPIKITSAYKSPQLPLIREEVQELLDQNTPLLIVGDLNWKNVDWNSRTTNANGLRLAEWTEASARVIGPTESTYIPYATARPDILDIAIVQNLTEEILTETLNQGTSDHNPVLVKIGTRQELDSTRYKKKTNWTKFQQDLNRTLTRIPKVDQTDEIDQAVECFQNQILEAAENNIVVHRRTQQNYYDTPQYVRNLITENWRLRRRYARSHREEDRLSLNEHSRLIKASLKEFRQNVWDKRLAELQTTNQTAWQMQKALRREKTTIPPIHGLNGIAHEDVEKAEAFADTMENECRINEALDDSDEDEEHTAEAERTYIQLRNTEPVPGGLRPASLQEIKNIVKKLKVKKSPGYENITNQAIKSLPKKGPCHLLKITNSIIRFTHFPNAWKIATVIMIPKPRKNHTFPQNYRPISLLPGLSKVVERIILNRLNEETAIPNVIPDHQFGFRAKHSTEHQVLRVVNQITTGFNNRDATGALFIDITRAFDRVWHQGLIHKMTKLGYSNNLTKLIHTKLPPRTQSIGKNRKSLILNPNHRSRSPARRCAIANIVRNIRFRHANHH